MKLLQNYVFIGLIMLLFLSVYYLAASKERMKQVPPLTLQEKETTHKDLVRLGVLASHPRELFRVTYDNKIMSNDVDITDDDKAIADCVREYIRKKTEYSIIMPKMGSSK